MRVLAVELTEWEVRWIEVDLLFGRAQVHNLASHRLSGAVPAEQEAGELLKELANKAGKTVVLFPSTKTTIRNLSLASKNKRTVDRALIFELEDELPFDPDQMVFDSAILSSSKVGSEVHVVAARKELVAGVIAAWGTSELDPDLIVPESWGLRCAAVRTLPTVATPGPRLFIHFRKEQTLLLLIDGGTPIAQRDIPFGTGHLESALIADAYANPSDSEAWVRDMGLSDSNPRFKTALLHSLESLRVELLQIDLAARSLTQNSISEVFLVGEAALIPGLDHWIQTILERPTKLFRPLSLMSEGKINYSDVTEANFSRLLGVALSAAPHQKVGVVNLRRGEFAKVGADEELIRRLVAQVGPSLAIAAAVSISVGVIEYLYFSKKIESSEDALVTSVRNYYGGLGDGAARSKIAARERMRRSIEEELRKDKELSKISDPSSTTPVQLLRELSSNLPRDIIAELQQYQSGQDSNQGYNSEVPLGQRVTFRVANAQMGARLTQYLDQTYQFKKIETKSELIDGEKKTLLTYTKGTL
jgi:Tfp pilus assembly PilM family ATPase